PRSSEASVRSASPSTADSPGASTTGRTGRSRSAGMAADLPAQLVGDLHGQRRDRWRLDPPTAGDVHVPGRDDPAGAGGQQQHALPEPYRLATVVRDEHDADPGGLP